MSDDLPNLPLVSAKRLTKREREKRYGEPKDEPPLSWRIRERWPAWLDWLTVRQIAAVVFSVFIGSLLIGNALDRSTVSAYYISPMPTLTMRAPLPPTITNTPLPTQTRFPIASVTPENRVLPMLITGLHHYGWHGKMEDESSATQSLCNTYTKQLCDYGFSAVNLGLWTGNWETEPQRFLVWLKFAGFGRYWYELQDGKGDRANLEPHLEYDHLDLSRGICVPALWNIYTTDRLERLNGLIGFEIRRTLLGEAGVGDLDERVTGIPDVLQLEIWDKPPDSCIQVIPNGFPAKYLPEWVEIEQ